MGPPLEYMFNFSASHSATTVIDRSIAFLGGIRDDFYFNLFTFKG